MLRAPYAEFPDMSAQQRMVLWGFTAPIKLRLLQIAPYMHLFTLGHHLTTFLDATRKTKQ